MTKHARGRVTAMPDIAGDLERALALVEHCASILPGDVGSDLSETVATALEAAEEGCARDHVVARLTEFTDRTLDRYLKSASRELSAHTEMPPAALRTAAGWNKALERQGHGINAVGRLDTLPGTLVVLAVRDMVAVASLRTRARSGEFAEELQTLWESTPTSGRTFDAVVDSTSAGNPRSSRIGWALINLEGRRHVNLIWHQANKLQRSIPDREASELLTWGWVGLRTALRNYNPNLGFAFSTYACTRIVGAIRDGVRAESPIPKRLGTMARKAAAVEADLLQSLGRAPTFDEITEALAIEAGTLQAIRRTRTPLSIDEMTQGLDRSGANEPAWMADSEDVETTALLAVQAELVAHAMEHLPSDEAEAVRLLILEDRPPSEARQIAGVTARQLRQRKERAIATLRQALDGLADLG